MVATTLAALLVFLEFESKKLSGHGARRKGRMYV
jgi:hypothetical protein